LKTIISVILALALGASCGWFQYWMARWLDRKRWLLWLQPALAALMGLCFLAWSLSLHTAPLAAVPFGLLLVVILVGWVVGCLKRNRPPKED